MNRPFLRKASFLLYDEWRLSWTPNGACCTNNTPYKMWCHDFSLWLRGHQSTDSHSYAARREFQLSYTKKKSVSSMCADIWVGNTVSQHLLYMGFDMYSLEVLFTAAADLQINRFLEAFHVTQPGKTHADTTCSYSTSWEALIFNTFGPYTRLQLGSNLQLGWFWQLLNLCVHFVNKCQIQLYYQHTKLSVNASAFHKNLISVIYTVQGGLTDH